MRSVVDLALARARAGIGQQWSYKSIGGKTALCKPQPGYPTHRGERRGVAFAHAALDSLRPLSRSPSQASTMARQGAQTSSLPPTGAWWR